MENRDFNIGTINAGPEHILREFQTGNVDVLFEEEIDNIVGAGAQTAYIDINDKIGRTEVNFVNDGKMPDEKTFNNLGTFLDSSSSSKDGVSMFGSGTFAADRSAAARKSSKSELDIRCVKDGIERYKSIMIDPSAEGEDVFTVRNYAPIKTDDSDHMEKAHKRVKTLSNDDKERMRLITEARCSQYLKKNNPLFMFCGTEMSVIDLEYQDKEYDGLLQYNRTYDSEYGKIRVKVISIRDVAYESLNKYDRFFGSVQENTGAYLLISDIYAITNSWKLVGKKYHSTNNGIKIFIELEQRAKYEVFESSAIKSSKNVDLSKLEWFAETGAIDFIEDCIAEIKEYHEKERTEDGAYDTFNAAGAYDRVREALAELSQDEYRALCNKKVKTILSV